MDVKPNSDPIRDQLAKFARSEKSRVLGFPRDWKPNEVVNPDDDQVFSPAGAWMFIARKLEEGHPYEIVLLKEPPGKKGYVMKIAMGTDKPNLYVKLQLGSGQVVGRSFHYEHPGE